MDKHRAIANKAAEGYPIEFTSTEFIAQSGGTIYKLTSSSGGAYCLRLYASANDALGPEWTGETAIRSMLEWMRALGRDLPNIMTPRPISNTAGAFVTEIDGIFCTLETWLAGEQKPYFMTEKDARAAGVLLARLHGHAAAWEPPAGFVRPAFESACIWESIAALEKSPLPFSKESRAAICAGAEKAARLLDTYDRSHNSWGIIHADIIPPNLLYYEEEIRPIDFGACGFGHYLWDIATTLPFVPLPYRKALLSAYDSVFPLPENYTELLEGFFIACRLQVLGFFLHLPDAAEWVPGEYEKLSQRELCRYLMGESFLYEGKPSYE